MEHLKLSCNFNSEVLLKEYYVCELSFTLIITNTEDIYFVFYVFVYTYSQIKLILLIDIWKAITLLEFVRYFVQFGLREYSKHHNYKWNKCMVMNCLFSV